MYVLLKFAYHHPWRQSNASLRCFNADAATVVVVMFVVKTVGAPGSAMLCPDFVGVAPGIRPYARCQLGWGAWGEELADREVIFLLSHRRGR